MSDQTGNKMKTQNGSFEPLGVSYDGQNSNVSLVWQEETPVWLLLYRENSKTAFAKLPISQSSRVGDILSIQLLDFDIRKYSYNFLTQIEKKEVLFQDPFARCILGRRKFGVRKALQEKTEPAERTEKNAQDKALADVPVRCAYVDLKQAPVRNNPVPYDEMIAYGIHVRGFSKKLSKWGIAASERGTFLALKKSIPYFTELGINYISLMPCYEFDEVQTECSAYTGETACRTDRLRRVNYWGYVRGDYFAPKAAYGAAKDVCAEFYDMVEAFHEAGIEVGMELFFPEDVIPKFMEEVAVFWVKHYGIDGFRIYCSEIGKQHLVTVPYLGRTKLIFGSFEELFGKVQGADFRMKWKQTGIAASSFKSAMRSFLKGDFHTTQSAFEEILANGDKYSRVNYMAGHDGFTLCDSVSYDYKHNEANGEENKDGSFENFSWNCGAEGKTRKRVIQNLRLKMMQNAFTLLLLSQGAPYIYGGDEFANSQEGNNNAWCQDNETGWLDWKTPKCYEGLLPFVKNMIAFRKKHKIFHQKLPLKMFDTLSCGYPDVSCHGKEPWRLDFDNDRHGLGLLYSKAYTGEEKELVYVVYNMYWEKQEFHLPRPEKDRAWQLVLDTQFFGEDAFCVRELCADDRIFVSPRSIQVYETRKITKQKENVGN